MDKAVERIKKALAKKEKMLIYGDFDVDGVTSLALLSLVFKEIGAVFETFIPNRLEDGYGLNISAVNLAKEKGVKLLITVDCGINSFKEVEYANSIGLDVIITDHHEVRTGNIPPALAVVNTHQPACSYPYKNLAGVAVAYKLARGLLRGKEEKVDEHLDLVALGTIADVAPLTGENRILVKEGLKKLSSANKYGIKALMDVAKIKSESLNSRHVAFILAPRINAMGRMGAADLALELLVCKDKNRAYELAEILEKENRNRQNIEKALFAKAIELHQKVGSQKDNVIILAEEGWHPGVLGIAASRMTENYNMPTILISLNGENGRGSGRSINGFNLFEALEKTGEHLIDFGGHSAACGIKIEKKNLDNFKKAINALSSLNTTDTNNITQEISIDLVLPFSAIGAKLIKELELLMPFGEGNEEPLFVTRGMKVKNIPRAIAKDGFKFLVMCGNLSCEAITFKKHGIIKPSKNDVVNIAYSLSLNTWAGIDTVQMNIKDLNVLSKSVSLTQKDSPYS
ncbi:single-stranded-DNA-specific exonuclease RecJ [Candidatus Omnitrophus magneticus]|uniref:Single-stranded-DNA-specific exonuclease RecJ n=1 Tax=Candidatus Omnitrophus magneticus TaxID=1609969 RepID=A0A0F0CSY8_9BACT|nr:single-stranded-DNA-specific exonuclease RecJ [Candidatus Omnitrophus magneticus]